MSGSITLSFPGFLSSLGVPGAGWLPTNSRNLPTSTFFLESSEDNSEIT